MSKNNQNKRMDKEKLPVRLVTKPHCRVHFIGIGGVSMYGLARLVHSMGANVSGSDASVSERVNSLSLEGIPVFTYHSPENLGEAELVVYSHAISGDNPELKEAIRRQIPVISRAEYMGALMLSYKTKIGVSGTHGKSTTTAMLDRIFETAGMMPTVLSGAELECGEPVKIGEREALVYEACEYRDSFLSFSPTVAVALNLEMDHPDYFKDEAALRASFTKALARASDFAVISSDDKNLMSIIPAVRKKTKVVTFGINPTSDYSYFINSFSDRGFVFRITHNGKKEDYTLNIQGIHNVSNAVAAIVAALELGIPSSVVSSAIAEFSGIPRRLEYIGSRYGRAVFYDYAHHPTEISTSISALKLAYHDSLTVVFKPHTYTRTKFLWEEFCSALSLADKVIVTDIYPAREEPIDGVTGKHLADDIGSNAEYAQDSEVVDKLDAQHIKGSIVLMGAGDFENIKYDVLNK